TETQGPAQWIGPAPSRWQFSAAMFVGVCGIMIAGLQPLLLGALEGEGRINANQLGQAATAELLTMGLAAGIAGAALKPQRLKLIAVVVSLILAAIDAATPLFKGDMITVARAAAGIPSGVQMWVVIALIARSPTPERWSGVYLTVQTAAQFVLASILGATLVQTYGADGGWIGLAAFCVLTAIVSLWLPDSYAPLPKTEGNNSLPGLRGWIALASAFLFSAFTIGVWVYAEPLSTQAHHDPDVYKEAVSVSLACQVAGGAAATFLAGRINWMWTTLVSALLAAGVIAGLATLPGPVEFLVLSGAFGFLWLFVLPFLVPMIIEADPTRRAAVLIGGAQVLGGSFGPFFASLFVTDIDARGALALGGVCLALSVIIAIGLHQLKPRTKPVGEAA
ncbi:MAG TPA: MFS transporter, partial [Hyphomonadaceae bacterium]|nr:MFS transporter [Hyphomonadaceae bacterium]